MPEDAIEITILPDGTIKAETSKISQANHALAHNFFNVLEELTGAKASKVKRGHGHVHNHVHEHEKGKA